MSIEGSPLQDVMYEAVASTLGSMAFREVIPERDVKEPPSYCARLDVYAPAAGTLRLIVNSELAAEITKGLHGPAEEPPTEEMLCDTLAELLNAIAGCVMHEITPPNEIFSIGLPKTFRTAHPAYGESEVIARFSVDGQPLLLIASGSDLLAHCKNLERPES